jgi:hypothetical protein
LIKAGTARFDQISGSLNIAMFRVEKDFTAYGGEVKFGSGKVIRDGMGQSQLANAQGAVVILVSSCVVSSCVRWPSSPETLPSRHRRGNGRPSCASVA